MKTKLISRVRCTHFFSGTHLRPAFIVEILRSGHWLPLGTRKGITRHKTRAAAEACADKTIKSLSK